MPSHQLATTVQQYQEQLTEATPFSGAALEAAEGAAAAFGAAAAAFGATAAALAAAAVALLLAAAAAGVATAAAEGTLPGTGWGRMLALTWPAARSNALHRFCASALRSSNIILPRWLEPSG